MTATEIPLHRQCDDRPRAQLDQHDDRPLVSIVLTVYNMEACLPECLESLRAQTYRNIELICIDDGSTDGSLRILHEFAATHDAESAAPSDAKQDDTHGQASGITVISQNNAGPAAARNAGLALAQGEYVMLLDSDDVFDPALVAELLRAAETHHADIAICRSSGFDHATRKPVDLSWAVHDELLPGRECFKPTDLRGCPFTAFMGWPWDRIYRTAFLRRHDLLFPDLPNSEDLSFAYGSLVRANSICFVDKTLIAHRMGRSASVSSSRLSSPRSFYDAICLLKDDLRQNESLYQHYEWGFLNWAFDYTIWNINSLPQGTARDALVRDFVSGNLEALEVSRRPLSYYSLYPNNLYDFRNLQDEVAGTIRKGKLWESASRVCAYLARKGLRAALARITRGRSG